MNCLEKKSILGPFLNNQAQNVDERQTGMQTPLGHTSSPVASVPFWTRLLMEDVPTYPMFSLPGFNLPSLN